MNDEKDSRAVPRLCDGGRLLAGCGGNGDSGSTNESAGGESGTLTVPLASSPSKLDPIHYSGSYGGPDHQPGLRSSGGVQRHADGVCAFSGHQLDDFR